MILFTGKGTSGSWKIRGEQLGRACGGVVKPRATLDDCKKADLIVLVKRPSKGLMDVIKQSGTPWVWDVVDFYPQPQCSDWVRSKAINWVKGQLARHRPDGVVWPNHRMMDDCGKSFKGAVVYHHHRPGLALNPIRETVKTVGYEGCEKYLGHWSGLILSECRERGWEFVINQGSVADFDICVAFRDSQFNGYAQYHWKSNVKLANCHGAGTPFIGPGESGYWETATGGEVFIEGNALKQALDALESHERRLRIREQFISAAIPVEQSAKELMRFLSGL